MSDLERRKDSSLLDSLSRALAPIPYWIGYKREKFWSHEVPETAIVAELRETLMLAFGRCAQVHCEVPYNKVDKSETAVGHSHRSQRVDLAIFQSDPVTSQTPVAIIEVKRGYRKNSIETDVKRLAGVIGPKTTSSFRAFIVLVSEGHIPRFALAGDSCRAKGAIRFKSMSANVLARRAFTAASSIEKYSKRKPPKHLSQHWVVLFEIISGE